MINLIHIKLNNNIYFILFHKLFLINLFNEFILLYI